MIFCGILGTNFSHCQVTKALDALLVGLSDVAKKASEELGEGATEAQIVDRTIKLFLGIQPLVGRGLGPEPLKLLQNMETIYPSLSNQSPESGRFLIFSVFS